MLRAASGARGRLRRGRDRACEQLSVSFQFAWQSARVHQIRESASKMRTQQAFIMGVSVLVAGKTPKPMYDPMAVGLVFAGNEETNVGKANPSVELAGKAPDIKGECFSGFAHATRAQLSP